jgi:hypothetical protein
MTWKLICMVFTSIALLAGCKQQANTNESSGKGGGGDSLADTSKGAVQQPPRDAINSNNIYTRGSESRTAQDGPNPSSGVTPTNAATAPSPQLRQNAKP